jgi:hypothetical protein
VIDVEALRARLATEPYRSAAHVAWRVESVEGLLAHFLASDALSTAIAAETTERNTDDRALIEFGAGRALDTHRFTETDFLEWSTRAGARRPSHITGTVDWTVVESARASLAYLPSDLPQSEFARAYGAGNFALAREIWRNHPWTLVSSRQTASVAHTLATAGDESALPLIDAVRPWQPIESDALTGILRLAQGRNAEAAPLVGSALLHARTEAWMLPGVLESSLVAAVRLASDSAYAPAMLDALSRPYAAQQFDHTRRIALVGAAWQAGQCSPVTLAGLRDMEPHSPWNRAILQLRERCYGEWRLTELHFRAKEELAQFERVEAATVRAESPRESEPFRREVDRNSGKLTKDVLAEEAVDRAPVTFADCRGVHDADLHSPPPPPAFDEDIPPHAADLEPFAREARSLFRGQTDDRGTHERRRRSGVQQKHGGAAVDRQSHQNRAEASVQLEGKGDLRGPKRACGEEGEKEESRSGHARKVGSGHPVFRRRRMKRS